MAYKAKAYTLREESTESGIRYFISFKDGQGEHHELEVSEQLFFEFRQMERRNRNLLQWDERHREFSEVYTCLPIWNGSNVQTKITKLCFTCV